MMKRTPRRALRIALFALFSGLGSAWATEAKADDAAAKGERAGVAYDLGAAAFDAKDYVSAAEHFAEADRLAPNPLALKLALDSAMRAGRAGLVMDLATRAETRSEKAEPALAHLVQRARTEFQDRAGTLTVHCDGKDPCTALVDERAVAIESRTWLGVGRHIVSVSVGQREERRDIVIAPREHEEIRASDMMAEPPALPARTPAPQNVMADRAQPTISGASLRKLSPTWVWVGAATTAIAGGLAIASGVDTVAKHDAYRGNPTDDGRSEGMSAQTRTNVLLGITATLAVSTTALAVFFVKWSSPTSRTHARAPRTSLGLGPCLFVTTKF